MLSGKHGAFLHLVQHSQLQGVQHTALCAVGVGVGAVGAVDLLLCGGDVQLLRNGLKDQILLGQMLKVGVRICQHRVGIGVALGLCVGVQLHAVLGSKLRVIVQEHTDVVAGDLGGDLLEGGVIEQIVHHGVVQIVGVQGAVKVLAQGVCGVQIVAGGKVRLHPLVGQGGHNALGDGVQCHAEHGFLAAEGDGVALGVGGVAVALREGDGHIKGVADIVADDLVLKAVNEGVAAQRQVVACSGAAGKGHPVHRARNIYSAYPL